MTDEAKEHSAKFCGDAALAHFCTLRSAVIDLFADAETQIAKYVSAHSAKAICLTYPLSQKIDVAMKVAAGPQRSKAIKAEADAQLKAIQDLLPDRAAIVHSRMSVAQCISGKFVAIFKNAKNVVDGSANALVYDEYELASFLDRLKQVNSKLETALWAKNRPAVSQK
jgi:hypothetical protein